MKKHWMWLPLAGWLFSCGGSPKSEGPAPTPQTIASRVEKLAPQRVPVTATASGTVEAKVRTVLAAQVMGAVRAVNAEVGQAVKAGQVLVVIDPQQFDAAAAQAAAARAEARTADREVTAMIEGARTQLELARATEARLEKLFARKSLTVQEMDEAVARRKQAEAALRAAEARREQVAARIEQAEQGLKAAETQRGYATLTAPFAGVVVEKLAQVGSLAAPGAPLLVVERQGGLRAALNVEESLGHTIRLGLPLSLTGEGNEAMPATVTEIVPMLDAATRNLIVKADLPASAGLRSGAFVRGEWAVGEREALTVPAAAVRETGQLQMVFVVENGLARSRMVSLGAALAGRREVLSGLATGEMILVGDLARVTDGVKVEVLP